MVKEYGDSGRKLMDRIAKGIKSSKPKVVAAAGEAFDALKAKLVESRDGLRSTLEGLEADFAALADSVKSSLTGDLFSVSATEEDKDAGTVAKTVGQNFIDGLMGKKAELTNLLSSFKTLQGWGIPATFLSQLFASGNGALITELAGMGQAGASQAATLFGEVSSLGDQLGNAVASNDPVASRIDETNKKLQQVIDAIGYMGSDLGAALDGAAAKARHKQKQRGKK